VQGLGGGLTTLSQVGISFQKDGSLAVDSTKLNSAMTNNFDDIAGLFAAIGIGHRRHDLASSKSTAATGRQVRGQHHQDGDPGSDDQHQCAGPARPPSPRTRRGR
jgi:flagellar capping protein FliD